MWLLNAFRPSFFFNYLYYKEFVRKLEPGDYKRNPENLVWHLKPSCLKRIFLNSLSSKACNSQQSAVASEPIVKNNELMHKSKNNGKIWKNRSKLMCRNAENVGSCFIKICQILMEIWSNHQQYFIYLLLWNKKG